jgi:hypothetical protein
LPSSTGWSDWCDERAFGRRDGERHAAPAPRSLRSNGEGWGQAAGRRRHIADTLGWILYKQAAYPRALALLSESAAKLGDDPEVVYDLGLANHKLGRRADAEEALTMALTLSAAFSGAEDAKAVLATLK